LSGVGTSPTLGQCLTWFRDAPNNGGKADVGRSVDLRNAVEPFGAGYLPATAAPSEYQIDTLKHDLYPFLED
jgi:hypothetical protein